MQKENGFTPSSPKGTKPEDTLARYEKTESGLYLVHLSEFYDGIAPNQEPVAIEESVLLTLIQFKRDEKKHEMQDYRHRTPFYFDELLTASIDDIKEPSAAEIYHRDQQSAELESALNTLKPVIKRRVCLMYFEKYTQEQIANMENVSQGAVQKSIARALKALRRLLEISHS